MRQQGFVLPAIIAFIVAAVIGVGAAAYFSQRDDAIEQSTTSPDQDSQSAADDQMSEPQLTSDASTDRFTGTVTDLLKEGQNLTCTFSRNDLSGTIAGTVYVAGQGQRLRGDFTVDQPNGTAMNAHLIRAGDFAYFWSDELAQGTKLRIEEQTPPGSPTTSEPREQSDVLDDTFNYDCQPWSVDTGVFTLPTDKEFVDLTEQLQQINAATESIGDAQCSGCDQLQGAAQAQCREALGCP